jgi:hypothetical protein
MKTFTHGSPGEAAHMLPEDFDAPNGALDTLRIGDPTTTRRGGRLSI